MKLIILLAALVLGGCCAISTVGVGVDLEKSGSAREKPENTSF